MRKPMETETTPTETEVAETLGALEKGLQSGPVPARATPGMLWLFAGVIFPAFVVGLEAISGLCASALFDPMPTIWHLLIASSVPAANFLVWLSIHKGWREHALTIAWLNGAAIGVSAFYTLVFLPVLPIAVIAVVFYGLGALPMAPLFALIAAAKGRRYLLKSSTADTRPLSFWPGFLFAIAVLVGAELPGLATNTGLQMAASNDPVTSRRGIRFLQTFGDTDLLLRRCYARPGTTDLMGFLFANGEQVSPDQARKIYYRVTGEPFGKAPRPHLKTGRTLFADEPFDADRAAGAVGGQATALSLSSSRMDGSVDADAGVSYLEWTLVFKNNAVWPQEARTEIALPEGGVVSRVTLWINGEEQEAAFGGRAETRQAYTNIVAQRRDPLLVTTSGAGRALVQCFPVPANGEMKIRIGVTAPLELENLEEGKVRLPYLLESNFKIDNQTTHAVWVEASQPLTTANDALKPERSEQGAYALRGLVRDSDLPGRAAIYARRSRNSGVSWGSDPHAGNNTVIVQRAEEQRVTPPSRVVLVIDGSRAMRGARDEVAASLAKLPRNLSVAAVVAGDEPMELAGADNAALARQLRALDYSGGRDNVPALARGWDIAAQEPGAAIVWIHGPQQVVFHPIEDLKQRWERRPQGPRLYDLPVANGSDVITASLDGVDAVRTIRSAGGFGSSLERLFASWDGQSTQLVFVRDRAKAEKQTAGSRSPTASSHLARLWARDETLRLITMEKPQRDEAIKIASAYQIVTPVSGAVVLESEAQYKVAGLEQAPSDSVPTVPEPEEWALMLIVAMILAWMLLSRRLRWKTS
jgi:hypothetical protein